MLDLGWPEILLVGAITLIAVGPKDLPKVMQAVGRFIGKARRMMLTLEHHVERLGHEASQLEDSEKKDKKPPSSNA